VLVFSLEIAAAGSDVLPLLAAVIALKMKFNIEEPTYEFLNQTGLSAFLLQILEANRAVNRFALPAYQKWVMVILGDGNWQLYCRDISGNFVFRETLAEKEPVDTNIMQVTLVIEYGLMKAQEQIVFDKSESIYSQEFNTVELSTLLE
jgi:hypothetical protein